MTNCPASIRTLFGVFFALLLAFGPVAGGACHVGQRAVWQEMSQEDARVALPSDEEGQELPQFAQGHAVFALAGPAVALLPAPLPEPPAFVPCPQRPLRALPARPVCVPSMLGYYQTLRRHYIAPQAP
jgi:hypothetical protein